VASRFENETIHFGEHRRRTFGEIVCPATDPAWLPLFANARGLVMETGGVLSHGAILAREFGLPAVAGLPGACQTLQTGQFVRVDGSNGTVAILPKSQAPRNQNHVR
jgi:phosphoenolpyruvate synthase/pyruvate phosphate dikinase